MIFRTLFTYDGMINALLMKLGLISEAINWLNDPVYAKAVIIIGLIWRWTGYNMVFYLSAMQGIEYSIYEAARIDGASHMRQIWHITLPGIKGIIAINATAKSGTISRIVPTLKPGAVVSIQRNIVDYIVTEYGIAHLRGKTVRQRVNEMISIAAPEFREELRQQADKLLLW